MRYEMRYWKKSVKLYNKYRFEVNYYSTPIGSGKPPIFDGLVLTIDRPLTIKDSKELQDFNNAVNLATKLIIPFNKKYIGSRIMYEDDIISFM